MGVSLTLRKLIAPVLVYCTLLFANSDANAQLDYATPYTFSTVAGTSAFGGNDDGSGQAARFARPYALAVNSSGNVFVADTLNGTVRMVTSGGTVTTIAGAAGNLGSADGTGGAAQFNQPSGIAVDSNGNLFVADTINCTIRKITQGGVVTTIAGSAELQGSTDGVGASARFYSPTGVAVDSNDNLYVTDTTNCTIRKITPAGLVSTLAGVAGSSGIGDGTGSLARFNTPTGIAIDGSGNLYVADSQSDTIRKVTPSGVVTTLAGTAGVSGSADGTGAAAQFRVPNGVAVDGNGNVYVADSNNSTIRKLTPNGVVTTFLGTAGTMGSADGIGNAALFNQPFGLAVGGNGNLYIADSSNNTVRTATSGGSVTTIAGSPPGTVAQDGQAILARFANPSSIVKDGNGNLFVTDTGANTIRKITSSSVVSTFAGVSGTAGHSDGAGTSAQFSAPTGLAVDGAGNLVVADSGNNTIRRVSSTGAVTTLAGNPGTAGSQDGTGSSALFDSPNGVAIDSSGNVYVADSGNNTIREISPSGVVSTIAGLPSPAIMYPIGLGPTSVDGTGTAARFVNPMGIVVDHSGNLYVADSGSSTIRKVAPGGVVTTIAGVAGLQSISANGDVDSTSADTARFNQPAGIAIDGGGNLFIADKGNNSIREVAVSGAVTTLAGNRYNSIGAEATDGTGSIAQFFGPSGITVDPNGNLYVADGGNQEIRLGVATPTVPVVTVGVQGGTVTTGSNPTLSVTAYGSGLTYQWQFDGVNIPGATAPTLQLSNFGTNQDGTYGVTITNSSGGSTTTTANLSAVSVSKPINVSTRGFVGTGSNILIAGFIVSGTTSETLLIRGIGPGLSSFNVSGVLPDPQVAVFNSSGVQIASNTSWGGSAVLSAIFARTGAFALATNSRDSALVITLPPGAYTAQVSGVSGDTGVALVEVYDVP